MSKNQKSKNYTIAKLYKILDYNSKKDIQPENERYLGSLSQRLKEISGEKIIYKKKISKEDFKDDVDYLKPKVVVHAIEGKDEPKPPVVKFEETTKREFRDEDVFEVKKVKIVEPEFIKVKPKVTSKVEIIEIKDLKAEEQKLPTFDSVEVDKKEEDLEELPELEQISETELKKLEREPITKLKDEIEEKEEYKEIINFCPECGMKIEIVTDICSNCGKDLKEDEKPSLKPIKSDEKELISEEWEPIEIEKPTEEEKIPVFEEQVEITAFKDIKTIDEEIAKLLINNGITTIELLKKATLKELKKIKGIKKKKAKKIKKEISEKKREKPVEIEVFEKDGFIEEKKPLDKELEEETEEWLSTEELTSETSVWEPIEEEIKEKGEDETPIFEELTVDKEPEKPIKDTDSKIEVFRDIKSIDSKTAILLFNNGYSNVDDLIKAPIKDLKKIKGIKRKTIKSIKKELEETKSSPTIVPFTDKKEKTKTENFLEIKDELETTKNELKVITKDLNKKESNIENLQKQLDDKIKELETKKTELFNRDEEIKQLQKESEQNKQDLDTGNLELNKKQEEMDHLQKELEEKLKELESKNIELKNTEELITQLQNQLEQNKQETETTSIELNKKEEEIEKIKKELQNKTEELDDSYNTITKLESNLIENKKELERKDKQIKIRVFKDIESIDDELAVILYDNGITSIENLNEITQKDLMKIKGIKRKTAKQIIKELSQKTEKNQYQEPKPEVEKTSIETIDDKEEIKIKDDKKPPKNLADENGITKDEAKEIDKKIAEEFSLILEDDDVFKDINSIDEKISNLLKQNGINTIEALKATNVKDLTRIRGIKRKVAKQIKKEIKKFSEKANAIESKTSFEPEEEKTDEEAETEWEYYDEDLISDSTMKEYKGFRKDDYTLYEKKIVTKSGNKRTVRFFSKAEPEGAEPIDLPKGYEVKKNKKTGIPYLRKKK
jgi:predicted RecB family nuclease